MPEQITRLAVDIAHTRRNLADAQRTDDVAREAMCLARLDALLHMADDALDEINEAKVTA